MEEKIYVEKGGVEVRHNYIIDDGTEKHLVFIVFVNDKFSHVSYPFRGPYTRKQWRVLAVIEDLIAELENTPRLWASEVHIDLAPGGIRKEP